jgi:hypothetical protein
VFDRIRRRGILKSAGRGAAGSARHVATWLAILGLYLQLFAVGLGRGGPLDQTLASLAQGAFPICHTSGGADPSVPAQAPDHHSCPFCALHCHAALVVAPSVGILQTFVAVPSDAIQASFLTPNTARFPAGAPPRGPPTSV